MPYESRFHEAFDLEADIDQIDRNVQIPLYKNDATLSFSRIGLTKETFMEVERKVGIEVFFLKFITQCQRSDILLATLCERYLKAKIRYG